MVHYFGIAYTVVLSVYLLVFAVIGGVLLERITSRNP